MKQHHLIKRAVAGLGCAYAAIILCALSPSATAAPAEKKPAAANAAGEATITVGRSPKLGSGTISVSIDGKRVGQVGSGRFSGSVPAGKHTLTVAFDPSRAGDKPASLEIDAAAGQTYGFLATIQHGDLVLTKNK